MGMKRVLLVEDEATQLHLLQSMVSRAGYEIETATNGQEAVTRLMRADAPKIDVVLLDLMMPGMDGIEVLQKIRPSMPGMPVVMLTAHSSIKTVVEAMRAGANDFISKPASAERIRTAIAAAIETSSLVGEIAPMTAKLSRPKEGFKNLIGASRPMLHAVHLAEKAASASIPVLIDGESGVGKEVFARAIHEASDRRNGPFVAVNCGAIPENLVESILFGHEKGSFTGAIERRVGKFQEAEGGTLFLDEVGELPLDMQVKLLRVLQEKEIDPVGGRQPVKLNIRVISATNRNLADLVAAGTFREDLYYRLNVFPINLPSLRERMSDVPALVDHFLDQISEMEQMPRKNVSSAALEMLTGYNWPGNIRQLQNAIFRAVIMSEGKELQPADFAHMITSPAEMKGGNNTIPFPTRPTIAHSGPGAGVMLDIAGDDGHIRSMAEIEAEVIAATIDRYNGRMAEVARRLGIGRSTLYRKVAEYHIDLAAE